MKLYKKLLLNTERGQTSEPALVNELLSLTQLNGIVFLWPSRALNLFISHQELIHNFPTHHGGRTDGAASWQRFSCTMCTGSVHERGTLRRLTFHKSQLIACDMHVVFHEETKRKDVRGRRSQTLSSNFHTYSSKVRVCSSLIPAAKWQIQGARVNISKGRGSLVYPSDAPPDGRDQEGQKQRLNENHMKDVLTLTCLPLWDLGLRTDGRRTCLQVLSHFNG